MKTVLEVIRGTTEFFTKHGVEDPRLNIEHLLAHVLGKKRMELYLEFDRPLHERELEPLRPLVRRRSQGEPLQHLLGTVEFLGRTFRCDARALIPRPETERLCELLLERWKTDPPARIIDVGTGSGVIALSFAAALLGATVEGVDLSPDALALAGENATALGLAERVRFTRSDLLAATEGTYSAIVANLPYIPTADLPGLAREVQRDPQAALDGGPKGLDTIRRLVAEAVGRLQGLLALEIGDGQADAVCNLLAEHKYRDISRATDYHGRNRFVFAFHG